MYMLYSSENGKRFRPMDMTEGVQVKNKLYATVYTLAQVEKLKPKLPQLEENNIGWRFEFRKV